jgi:hypothetical protein
MQDVLDATLWLGERLGYALGVALLVLGVATLAGLVFCGGDDGFRAVGEAAPPPERTSPFAPSRTCDASRRVSPGEDRTYVHR